MKKIKLGIIGTGSITERILPSILHSGKYHLWVIKSRNLNNAKNFAKKHNFHYYINNINDFKSLGVDCVYIASKTFAHYNEIKILLKNNIHVMCEKPIVLKLKELKEITKIAKEKKIILFEAYKTIYLKNYELIRDYLRKSKMRNAFFGFSKIHNQNNYKLSSNIVKFERDLYDLYFYPLSLSINIFNINNEFYPILEKESVVLNYKWNKIVYDRPIEIIFKIYNKYNKQQWFFIYSNFVNDDINHSFILFDNVLTISSCSSLSKITLLNQNLNESDYIDSKCDDLSIFTPEFNIFYNLIAKNKYLESWNILLNSFSRTKIIENINKIINKK